MEKSGELIKKAELGFKSTNFAMDMLSSLAMNTFGLDVINSYYRNSSHLIGTAFTSDFLKSLNITYTTPHNCLENIPRSGAAIVVCNHPMGALDGILLIDMIGKIRPDTKFLGNFLLMRLKTLSNFFLPVNPFDTQSTKNVSGIKKAVQHLSNGGLLIVFPAGEVSTYQKSIHIEDKPWGKSIMKFIQKAGVPIVPIHINGKNSLLFHITGKIHPILRTLQLPLELINKQNKTFTISIGSPIILKIQRELATQDKFASYIRNNVYLLKYISESKTHIMNTTAIEPLAERASNDDLAAEIERLKPCAFLFASSSFEIYFIGANDSSILMHEIAILREQTFRQVGEGTGKSLDTDIYDSTYHQLIMWDSSEKKIMGGYRVALG
ncbi:MAG: lysophospholipid acyltransferase family protein, partial [Rikenellaceae bacterium]